MRALALCVVVVALQPAFCLAQANAKTARATARPVKPETPHLEFVTEYIRELAAVERIRAAGQNENNEEKKKPKTPFAPAHHHTTVSQQELRPHAKPHQVSGPTRPSKTPVRT